MGFERFLFGVFYRVGFTPWEGHGQAARLRDLVEGPNRLPPGRALDIGCGTGDASIYLARHGWHVTGLDFVNRALARARRKAAAAGVNVRFVQGDATRLASYGLGPFDLVVDNGCLHGLSDEGRDAYVRDVTGVVSPGGRLIVAGFPEAKRRGPRGFNQPEIERRFAAGWKLLQAGIDPNVSNHAHDPIAVYELQRN